MSTGNRTGALTAIYDNEKNEEQRVHGVDWIDRFSLKIPSPLLENSLLNLVNLSIKQTKFAKNWNPQLKLPFHKKKAKDKIENYMPVSHLVQVGMITEYEM